MDELTAPAWALLVPVWMTVVVCGTVLLLAHWRRQDKLCRLCDGTGKSQEFGRLGSPCERCKGSGERQGVTS